MNEQNRSSVLRPGRIYGEPDAAAVDVIRNKIGNHVVF